MAASIDRVGTKRIQPRMFVAKSWRKVMVIPPTPEGERTPYSLLLSMLL
jgi:hypothetical protein